MKCHKEATARALIEAGANVNEDDSDGVTPLFAASREGNATMVRALLEAGADYKETKSGTCPYTIAKQNGHKDVVQALVKAAVDA